MMLIMKLVLTKIAIAGIPLVYHVAYMFESCTNEFQFFTIRSLKVLCMISTNIELSLTHNISFSPVILDATTITPFKIDHMFNTHHAGRNFLPIQTPNVLNSGILYRLENSMKFRARIKH